MQHKLRTEMQYNEEATQQRCYATDMQTNGDVTQQRHNAVKIQCKSGFVAFQLSLSRQNSLGGGFTEILGYISKENQHIYILPKKVLLLC